MAVLIASERLRKMRAAQVYPCGRVSAKNLSGNTLGVLLTSSVVVAWRITDIDQFIRSLAGRFIGL